MTLRKATEYDRHLLLQEIERLKKLGRSFQGATLEKQLGADAWVLQVGIVADKMKLKKKRK